MHMSDSLLNPAVGATMLAASAAAVAYSIAKIKQDDLCDKKIIVTGAATALVFAGQMLNFPIFGTGSSGHIGGGILLAALLGAFPATIAMAVVLTVQCLLFADGGILALGSNIFNMGVIPCLIIYPLIFKPLVKDGLTMGRIILASIAAVVAGLEFGAFGVVLQAQFSGVTELPFAGFTSLMLPIHLAIGFVEGIATALILCLVCKSQPEIMQSALDGTAIKSDARIGKVVIAFCVAAVIAGGVFSLFASSNPDGLEWAIEKTAVSELEIRNPLMASAAAIQEEKIAVMPDYAFRNAEAIGFEGTSIAGIAGAAIAFAAAWFAALAVSRIKRMRLVSVRR